LTALVATVSGRMLFAGVYYCCYFGIVIVVIDIITISSQIYFHNNNNNSNNNNNNAGTEKGAIRIYRLPLTGMITITAM
jgi:hypothetical protein